MGVELGIRNGLGKIFTELYDFFSSEKGMRKTLTPLFVAIYANPSSPLKVTSFTWLESRLLLLSFKPFISGQYSPFSVTI